MSLQLDQYIRSALKEQNLNWPSEDVLRLVNAVQSSLETDIERSNMIVKELAALSKFIEQTKHDIASVRAEEIKFKHIPTATDELDAIVGATEDATGAIMDACEAIDDLVKGQAVADKVTDQITKVYEACSFQDITGQRISKVVKALKAIDQQVTALLKAFGHESTEQQNFVDVDNRQGDKKLLNGPQLEGQGVSQDDIDRLLSF
jgi:chemotaxis protein CheZ